MAGNLRLINCQPQLELEVVSKSAAAVSNSQDIFLTTKFHRTMTKKKFWLQTFLELAQTNKLTTSPRAVRSSRFRSCSGATRGCTPALLTTDGFDRLSVTPKCFHQRCARQDRQVTLPWGHSPTIEPPTSSRGATLNDICRADPSIGRRDILLECIRGAWWPASTPELRRAVLIDQTRKRGIKRSPIASRALRHPRGRGADALQPHVVAGAMAQEQPAASAVQKHEAASWFAQTARSIAVVGSPRTPGRSVNPHARLSARHLHPADRA